MKIGLLQINPVVGDLSGNATRIAQAARRAAERGAQLCITSELALTGYPPRDLLLIPAFVDKARDELSLLASTLENGPAVLLGTAYWTGQIDGRPLLNCAALLEGGRVGAIFPKNLLPTYDVFDEDRYFNPGSSPGVLEIRGKRIGVTVCEDIWNDKNFWKTRRYASDPVEKLVEKGLDAIVNLSASPFTLGKQAMRERMLANTAVKYGLPILYCNQVGGNDDLIFDGRSTVIDSSGRLAARARAFEEDVLVVDLDILVRNPEPGPLNPAAKSVCVAPDDFREESEAWRALVLGIKDYAAKCGFKGALLGLSGGIDSALTAALAAEALGSANVLGVLLPSPYSSRGSLDDSQELAGRLGIATRTIPIAGIMAGFDSALAESFAGRSQDVTEENVQSRIRGNLLMAMSNKFGMLLLTTGNKSELAVGYCTIYGDMSGGLAVISDVPKTMVYRLAEYLNARGPQLIPRPIIDKPPSAELRPGQTDQDSLPPYAELDAVLKLRVEGHKSVEEIVSAGFDREMTRKICRLVKIAEFKRRQAAPGIKITDRAFGTGWRMPLACRIDY
jgi:NAD+ synthase/NAD+ synthase (glutamine-hydrolysing)